VACLYLAADLQSDDSPHIKAMYIMLVFCLSRASSILCSHSPGILTLISTTQGVREMTRNHSVLTQQAVVWLVFILPWFPSTFGCHCPCNRAARPGDLWRHVSDQFTGTATDEIESYHGLTKLTLLVSP
jgi:hypothetical protein